MKIDNFILSLLAVAEPPPPSSLLLSSSPRILCLAPRVFCLLALQKRALPVCPTSEPFPSPNPSMPISWFVWTLSFQTWFCSESSFIFFPKAKSNLRHETHHVKHSSHVKHPPPLFANTPPPSAPKGGPLMAVLCLFCWLVDLRIFFWKMPYICHF